MTKTELQEKLYDFIRPSYPKIRIEVKDGIHNRSDLYFTDEKFIDLYPKQRYHYLVNLIPKGFFDQFLSETTWYELGHDGSYFILISSSFPKPIFTIFFNVDNSIPEALFSIREI